MAEPGRSDSVRSVSKFQSEIRHSEVQVKLNRIQIMVLLVLYHDLEPLLEVFLHFDTASL